MFSKCTFFLSRDLKQVGEVESLSLEGDVGGGLVLERIISASRWTESCPDWFKHYSSQIGAGSGGFFQGLLSSFISCVIFKLLTWVNFTYYIGLFACGCTLRLAFYILQNHMSRLFPSMVLSMIVGQLPVSRVMKETFGLMVHIVGFS